MNRPNPDNYWDRGGFKLSDYNDDLEEYCDELELKLKEKKFKDEWVRALCFDYQKLRDCRNELCLMCGNYKEEHKGACDGCKWKEWLLKDD